MSGKRVAVVTVAFAAALVAIADLAWATAVATSGSWFSPAVSSQTYVVTLIASTLLVVGLAIAASLHIVSIGHAVDELDQRIAVIRGSARAEMVSSPSTVETDRDVEDELDDILGAMERDVALVEVRPSQAVVVPAATMQDARSLLRELVSERLAVRRGVSQVRWAIAPAVAAAIIFGAIASAMLPAVEVFAVANFQLNTAFVLFLAYGWPILVAWAVTAIAVSRHIKPL